MAQRIDVQTPSLRHDHRPRRQLARPVVVARVDIDRDAQPLAPATVFAARVALANGRLLVDARAGVRAVGRLLAFDAVEGRDHDAEVDRVVADRQAMPRGQRVEPGRAEVGERRANGVEVLDGVVRHGSGDSGGGAWVQKRQQIPLQVFVQPFVVPFLQVAVDLVVVGEGVEPVQRAGGRRCERRA